MLFWWGDRRDVRSAARRLLNCILRHDTLADPLYVQLNDPTLLHFDSFVGGNWVEAKNGQRFEVIGTYYAVPARNQTRTN